MNTNTLHEKLTLSLVGIALIIFIVLCISSFSGCGKLQLVKEPHETIPFLIEAKQYAVHIADSYFPSIVLFYDTKHTMKPDIVCWYPAQPKTTFPFRIDYIDSTGNILRTLWDFDMDGVIDQDELKNEVKPESRPEPKPIIPNNTNMGILK
jgi:hypothetical protein